MSEKAKLEDYEAMEIADFITGVENTDSDMILSENELLIKFGIDFETFHEIANSIFQMIDFGMSPLTNTAFVGISKGNEWLAKKEVDNQFISSLIQFLTDGEKIKKDKNGFEKVITESGKPVFKVAIYKPELNIQFKK